jgi:NO-binding membrane sensor protein with MHYT domain
MVTIARCYLELLTRYRLHQLGISVSLGLVGIWCMHYIGNRAIILGDGSLELQLSYNAGYTTLSVLLPIVILFLGLTLGEFLVTNHKTVWSFLIVGGVVVGLSITGMHYIGNLGISNYKLTNSPGYIAGAAAIAVGVSIAALSLFFYLKAKWIHSWPKRLAIAVLLACTVSGMHWLATVGTTYVLIELKSDEGTRDVNLIVATVCVSLDIVGLILD